MTPRYLIVNAEDFGRTAGVNRGVIQAHRDGIVTSASLMVRWPAAVEAAEYARTHSTLSVGLHVDLWEWSYRDNTWLKTYEVVSPDDRDAVVREVSAQLATFRALLGRNPTHIDSHSGACRDPLVESVLLDLAD